MRLGPRLAALALLAPGAAHADRPEGVCVEVSVDFTPSDALQIVAWIEDTAGTYVDTIYMTQKTGRFGLGNRPGRHDFNTGSPVNDTFPYGRRDQTFPVWAQRHDVTFPLVVFQNNDDSNLSHPKNQSSPETPPPYSCPVQPTQENFDSGTCASPAFSDKGMFADDASLISKYPPRSDLERQVEDSASVDQYREINPFDAISRATPAGGAPATAMWAAPQRVDYGDYVLFVEASKTYDFNATYNTMSFPAPTGISWGDFGKPWRGQPSVVYRVPFTVAMTATEASTDAYVGYGDPTGATGTLNPPDATITTDTPGSGASRMQLVSDGTSTYRVRVRTTTEFDATAPDGLAEPTITALTSTTASLGFIASGDDGMTGTLAGYDIRIRAGEPITADNFAAAPAAKASVMPGAPGTAQTLDLKGLLPETDYWVAIRPFDNCFNHGPVSIVRFTTLDREVSEVPWCFIATAAYGSAMANDVVLLRQFRDSLLQTSILGELAVETYYTFGPAAAGVISESDLLRASARMALGPIINWVRNLAY